MTTEPYVFNIREKQVMIGQASNLAAAHLREQYKDSIDQEGRVKREYIEAFKRLTKTYYISLCKIQRELINIIIKTEEDQTNLGE